MTWRSLFGLPESRSPAQLAASQQTATVGPITFLTPIFLLDVRLTEASVMADYLKTCVAKISQGVSSGPLVAPVSLQLGVILKPPGRARAWVAIPSAPELEKRLQPHIESVPYEGSVKDGPVGLMVVVDINGGDPGRQGGEGKVYMPEAWRSVAAANAGQAMDDAFFQRVWPD